MNKLKAILIDDEKEAMDSLELLLNEFKQILITHKLTKPLDLFSLMLNDLPDIIFLDINMPKINGLELLEKIKECCPKLPVIFVSAYDQFAMEAAKNNAFSYLLKPVIRDELKEVVKKTIHYLKTSTENKFGKIAISSKNETVLIDPESVELLKATGSYTLIKLTEGKELMTSYNMGTLLNKFPSKQFIRINRSVCVNRNHLISINRKTKTCMVRVNGLNKEFEASINFLKEFNTIFNNAQKKQ